jgi:hypothetical protein
MSTHYDPNGLLQLADELYQKAQGIVSDTALYYGLIAFFASLFFFGRLPLVGLFPWLGLWLGLTSLGVLTGVSVGKKKALAMKVQAQQILCQLQIEANTRQKYTAISPGS